MDIVTTGLAKIPYKSIISFGMYSLGVFECGARAFCAYADWREKNPDSAFFDKKNVIVIKDVTLGIVGAVMLTVAPFFLPVSIMLPFIFSTLVSRFIYNTKDMEEQSLLEQMVKLHIGGKDPQKKEQEPQKKEQKSSGFFSDLYHTLRDNRECQIVVLLSLFLICRRIQFLRTAVDVGLGKFAHFIA